MTVGVIETQMSQPRAAEGLRLRRHLRHGQGVRLRFSPRPAAAAADRAKGKPTCWAACWGKGRGAAADEKPVQGEPYFALVDEADSILIDEARTPLIISALPTEEQRLAVECYKWSASVINEFVEDDDYEYDHEKKTVELTREGRQKVRLLPKPAEMDTVGMVNIYQYIERAILVDREYHSRPPVRRPRRRDRDRRRVHRPLVRRAKMARRHPSGRRGQARRRGHRGHRPGGPDHRAGLLPPLRAPGGHDGHGDGLGPRTAANLSLPRDAHSHQPAGHPPAVARPAFSAPPTRNGRPSSRKSANCTPPAGRC